MIMRRCLTNLVSVPWLWDYVQEVQGAPRFKRELYRSKLHPPSKLLDFGCANSHLADAFIEFEYYGVDLDPDAIEAAKRRFEARPGMHFLAADLRTRPFQGDFFDDVLFACTIHHLEDDLLKSLLAELHFCLRPSGIIHVFDLVYRERDRWFQKLVRRLDQGKFTRTLPQIMAIVEPLGLFECGEPSFHRPYGALIQDCDVVYFPLKKKAAAI
jgi:SAM-dependent methyltransferase